MWKIGNVEIKNRVVLAPMAGISNPSYMKIIEEMGCGLAFTELISAEAIVRNNKKTLDMLNGIDQLKMPVGIQIFGSNPKTMADAAKIITNLYKVQFIDINMGCPVPKIAIKSESGSALLKNPQKVYDIVSAVSNSINIPVTVKIRSGWDEKSINAVDIAKICEQAGASAISIHARTRSAGYSGKADWKIINEVKEAINIPVIGNGDILSCYDAQKMLQETNCDAVMIGRGALGNPWLIKQCVNYLRDKTEPTPINPLEKLKMMKRHYEILTEDKVEKLALLEIRSHIVWYLKGMPNNKEIKIKICQTKTKEELLQVLNDYQKYLLNTEFTE